MARTKASSPASTSTPSDANSATTHHSRTVRDPWDEEHQASLETYGPTASTDIIYPFVKHSGFDAHYTAEMLQRRYPPFEEEEQHRKVLVRSLSEKLRVDGEKSDYFTPEELWREDDRLRGKKQFTKDDEVSWDDQHSVSEHDSSPASSAPQTSYEDALDLPITFESNDHRTTITRDHHAINHTLVSFDLSTNAAVTTSTLTFADGTLCVATLGRAKSQTPLSHETSAEQVAGTTASASDAMEVDEDRTVNAQSNAMSGATERPAGADEWNTVVKRRNRPTSAFLSGAQTFQALMATIRWDASSVTATTQRYVDGRTMLILVGKQAHLDRTANNVLHAPSDFVSVVERFFNAASKTDLRDISPETHHELFAFLQTVRRDLASVDILPIAGEVASSSSSEAGSEIETAVQGDLSDADFIQLLKRRIAKIEPRLRRAQDASLAPQPSVSYSKERMLEVLRRPEQDSQPLEHLNGQREQQSLSPTQQSPPSPATNAFHAPAVQKKSGFPADFGKGLTTIPAKSATKRPTKRRRVTPGPSDDDEGGDSDPSVTNPQKKKRKVRGTPKANPTPKRKAAVVSSPATPKVARRKKPARKPLTADQSRQSIADVKAQLEMFGRTKSESVGAGGSVVLANGCARGQDVVMDEEPAFVPEESEEE